ncbi:MAG TPA: chemotaxis response regulator protein-glutamate methylesterase [Candidatus Binatia bacterium]|nr:chemotaxis response regulator protein-glutamate methylesterase [Candidatus Binatia bacterium]
MLATDSGIEVVGTAPDPVAAERKLAALAPDVLTLDVEMPRMDGLAFLERLMHVRPMPVVMVSSLTQAGCETTLRALELGAVDVVAKPRVDVRERLEELARELVDKVKAAAHARVRPRRTASGEVRPASPAGPAYRPSDAVVVIGASTGGTEALREVLVALPPSTPGIVIVQHMPEGFTAAFARRLDSLTAVRVAEAADGDRVLSGHVLLAPGNRHVRLVRDGAAVRVAVVDGPPVNQHRPSVDVLFESAAAVLGPSVVGVLLTGMGRDGAQGLLALRRAGARTIAQDEATSVVWGMPREAIALGAAERVLPLDRVAGAILTLAASVRAPR